jgi:hypothetical protein
MRKREEREREVSRKKIILIRFANTLERFA